MGVGAQVSRGLARLSARRYRRILTALGISLFISAGLLGFIGLMRWRGHQALQSDTQVLIAQTSRQLLRALQSRRGTLTFLRDVLKRRPNLSPAQLQAMGQSAVEHTRHLLGVGWLEGGPSLVWWAGPSGLSERERPGVDRAVIERMQLRGAWRVPSTVVVTTQDRRPLLAMVEPLKGSSGRRGAVIGVFDAKPLLEDFFASNLPPSHPVQLLDGAAVLYRSAGWRPAAPDSRIAIVRQPVAVDAARWTIQMQPPSTGVTRTLSRLTVSLIGLGVLAGLGIVTIVWLLATRTWILQRAVARRTAALRQALRRVRQMAITDELTGLYNRRFFLKRWDWECDRAKRYQRPLACLMIDVNDFKQVNDRLGHHTGDLLLRQVAQELKTLLRQSDVLARLGGDEFVIALPETSPAQTASVAEKLRQVRIRLSDPAAHNLPPISLSVGMSRVGPIDESPQAVLEAADQSLYDEKRRLSTPRLPSPASRA